MVIGCYYLTIDRPDGKGAGRVFSSPDEAMMAYQLGQLSLQAPIRAVSYTHLDVYKRQAPRAARALNTRREWAKSISA